MVFSTNHAMLFPKDCGIPFGTLSNEEVLALSTELTEKEQAHPHAHYHDLMPAPLPAELAEAISGPPMDPSKGFGMEDYGKFMNNTGHCEVENGYCVLPNGVTYAAAQIRQEGRTDEMVDWYNKEFAKGDNLFYKIWNPEAHYLHYENGCVENFGYGRMNMKFAGAVQVEDLGMKYEEIAQNDPACIQIGGTTSIGYNLDSDHPNVPEWNTIVFYHRQTDYGREMRIRLWCGQGVDNGQYVYTIPAPEEALDMARYTMIHMMKEYTNDNFLEKRFWEDTKEEREG